MTDPEERLRALVQPALNEMLNAITDVVGGRIVCYGVPASQRIKHPESCAACSPLWNRAKAATERAAIIACARTQVEALRELECWCRLTVNVPRFSKCDRCLALAAAEALVARLESEAQKGEQR